MSRTPPLRIERDVIAGIAAMSPSIGGRLLSWGWRCYEGEEIELEIEKITDPGAVDALIAGSGYLDTTALQKGLIVVEAFEAARLKADEISQKRAQARLARLEKAEPTATERKELELVGTLPEATSRTNQAQRVNEGLGPLFAATPTEYAPKAAVRPAFPDEAVEPAIAAAIQDLCMLGMDAVEAHQFVGRLAMTYTPAEISGASIRMQGREVADPARYLDEL